ncbi:MAG: NAD(P)/FAD-dependent oxidoreductase [Pseudomonadales bacterium]|nr:NAD(P)/FAD-dependent oxidoreductase [Pseudomonadales bacterium]
MQEQHDQKQQNNLITPEQALKAGEDHLLIAILTQVTGDPAWLEEPYSSLCHQQRRNSKSSAEISEASTDTLKQTRQTLHTAFMEQVINNPAAHQLPLPDDQLMSQIMRFVTNENLPASHLEKLKYELKPVTQLATRENTPRIIIIGAGFSGLSVAIKLKEQGIPFRLLEKHAGVGGVWLENSYPGCGVDSPNHVYSFTNASNPEWSRYFVKRDEILEYIRSTVKKLNIIDSIEFGTDVSKMSWSAADKQWHIDHTFSDGSKNTTQADIIIPAVGTLNQTKYPEIEAIDDFEGDIFHTARWQHDVELKDRKIGMIGNGSSGFQVGPQVAKVASHLTSFQRSPAWTSANPEVNTLVSPEVRWLMGHVPLYASWHRFAGYWSSGDASYANLKIDPTWDGEGISRINEGVRKKLTEYIRGQFPDRQDLQDKMVPTYPPFTKRMVVDNGWLKSLARPNVALVTDEIVSATATGLVTADGQHHELDVIIFATGFYGTRFLWPTEVRGSKGRTPAEIAGQNDNILAYLGSAMPEFPNMFSVFGPNSSIGHGGSAVHVAECHATYISRCIEAMIDQNIQVLECKSDVCATYNKQLDQDMQSMVWTEPNIKSRYRNNEGRIVANHPWTLQRFWELTQQPDLNDYHIQYRQDD